MPATEHAVKEAERLAKGLMQRLKPRKGPSPRLTTVVAAVLVARDSSMSLTAAFGLVPGLEEDASSRRGCERCYRSKAICRPLSKRTMRRAQRAEHSNERSSNGSVGRTRRRLVLTVSIAEASSSGCT